MAGKRPFDFIGGTSLKAQMRQGGRCAHCATRLIEEMEEGDYVYGHHVVPNQCGNPSDPAHRWLKTELNCVALCQKCHMRVHQDGNTRNGAVAPPEYFPYSHQDAKSHAVWAAQVNQKAHAIWQYLAQKVASSGI
ncbi:HNH endonuclease signature motif containing protein [Variovorax sp. J22R133]|uniref:HNH endonuclease n=1 Tax=Variovorax brevis TaxID=3053503 RepID=UPI002577DCB2|nr:HNH endonuclease signature motif containing protein [Variovorax sp. J22R133]MDM0112247.1 HNH endonuclease signature motif containing protein [Variovorax sp. J22R133]